NPQNRLDIDCTYRKPADGRGETLEGRGPLGSMFWGPSRGMRLEIVLRAFFKGDDLAAAADVGLAGSPPSLVYRIDPGASEPQGLLGRLAGLRRGNQVAGSEPHIAARAAKPIPEHPRPGAGLRPGHIETGRAPVGGHARTDQ